MTTNNIIKIILMFFLSDFKEFIKKMTYRMFNVDNWMNKIKWTVLIKYVI